MLQMGGYREWCGRTKPVWLQLATQHNCSTGALTASCIERALCEDGRRSCLRCRQQTACDAQLSHGAVLFRNGQC